MVQILGIGFVAGLAAALLFGSATSGTAISIPLFYLASLPIAVAALGWSHAAGLVAALVAAGAIAAMFGGFYFVSFLVGVGLPAWWLGYLGLLARPVDHAPDGLEWYPVGRIVAWAAILGPAVVLIAIPYYGFDADSFRTGLRTAFERFLRAQLQLGADAPLRLPGGSDPARTLDVLVAIFPPMAAVLATLTSLVNLWLAGRIVKLSGRLKRPWPELPAMVFPAFAPMLLAGAVAATFLPGAVGILASALMASLLMAYVVLGFAVLHAITRELRERPLILGGVYATAALFGWTLLIVALLGLAEAIFAVRARVARRRGLPMRPE
ncbi:MAG: DUF2232 domain-containing protein [Xanthobacteraceae bacterium]|nr:DUF2232 domain-containing protein [Xanthobacteraceae bacterium]PWB61767.1 MAG: DUF2232 domain-containing protein [Bradyrhizobiaceae bacterium]